MKTCIRFKGVVVLRSLVLAAVGLFPMVLRAQHLPAVALRTGVVQSVYDREMSAPFVDLQVRTSTHTSALVLGANVRGSWEDHRAPGICGIVPPCYWRIDSAYRNLGVSGELAFYPWKGPVGLAVGMGQQWIWEEVDAMILSWSDAARFTTAEIGVQGQVRMHGSVFLTASFGESFRVFSERDRLRPVSRYVFGVGVQYRR